MTTLQLYTKGARVWLRDDELVWIGGELKKDFDGNLLEIELEDGREIFYDAKARKELPPLRNPDILLGENDLTTLSYLHEPAVLHNLQVRFLQSNAIYTYCGIVLVAINPYEQMPLYGPDIIAAYSGQSMGDMDPHIFAIAEDAYRCMSRDGKNQSIIVSGESGAGKTVSAKYAMRYFATVGGAAAETQIEKKVLASNPIMEAIGNAKTIRNDNSSRFGKYLEISFDKNQHIIGANMRTYLLEKARVVFQSENERNYHIFYQLCASCDLQELKDLRLAHQENFRYLNQGDSPYVDDVDDAECFEETREAMDLLGISQDDQMMVFRILAAVLHLGNVEVQNSGEDESAIENDDFHLSLAAELLGIDGHQLQKWICNRKIVTVGEVLIKPLNTREAKFGRDALSKHIYSQLFKWIVRNINKTLTSVGKQLSFIGVLDIYGFETFEVNSFEQFCINYANEKLQQQFTQHVFKLEQEEYIKEEIEWSFINFYDNQPCIDLIEAKLGILDLLNEECKMPKGSDLSWAQKLYKQHLKKAKHFDKARMGNDAFLIHHFADVVEYSVHGFVLKNRDRVNEEHLAILRASEYELVGDLFSENEAHQNVQRKRASSRSGKKESKTKMTVGSEFCESLKKLMGTLNSTVPHYIRCIKPNDEKAPFKFDPIRAMQQLRACGVLETVRISAAGYPSRWTYPEFFARYRMIVKSSLVNHKKPRDTIRLILETIIKDEDKFQLGKTKTFFRAGQVAYLEKLRSEKLRDSCIMIQKNFRCWREHRQYVRMRKAAILIQAWVRGHLARRLARSIRENKAAVTIQRYYRGYMCRSAYLYVYESIVIVQSYARGMFARKLKRDLLFRKKTVMIQRWFRRWLARKRYRKYRKSIILIQCCIRRMIAKRQLKKLKIEARSVDHLKKLNFGMENKIIELQQKLTEQVKETVHARSYQDGLEKARKELDEAKQWKNQFESTSARLIEAELIVRELKGELDKSNKVNEDLRGSHEEKTSEKDEVIEQLKKEVAQLREELAEVKAVEEKERANKDALLTLELEKQRQQLLTEFEAERRNHQRLIRENARLEQRYQNLQEELEIIERSPANIPFTGQADISASSSEASVIEAVENDTRPEGDGSEALERGGEGRGSLVSKSKLVGRLKKRIQELEGELLEMQRMKDVAVVPTINVERAEGEKPTMNGEMVESDKYEGLKKEKEELKNEINELNSTNKKMGSELLLLRKLVSQRNIDKQAEYDLVNERIKEISNERDDLRVQETRLKKELIKMASVAKSIADLDEVLLHNADAGAYALQAHSLKEANNVLQRELEELLSREKELKEANDHLWKEKAKLQRGRGGSIVKATDNNFQQEVGRLVTENVELKDQVEKLETELKQLRNDIQGALSPISRSRTMSTLSWRDEERKRTSSVWSNGQEPRAGKYVMKHAGLLKRSNTKEEEDILPVPLLKQQKSRGMIEYSPENEEKLIKTLIIDMNPSSMAENIPGLPAHILFMCIRHADHMNDDCRMQSLLSSSINSIRRVVKKYKTSFDFLAFWLANTCRLLHHMKQYSGDRWYRSLSPDTHPHEEGNVSAAIRQRVNYIKGLLNNAFQAHNTTEQNEQCLKNFDLTEYRQLLSDLAIHIYQDLVKAIWDSIQHMIVPGMLEYESIPGVSSSKPFGGRTRAHADITVKSITKQLSRVLEVLNLHCVNPDIIKQAFRQIFYYIGSNMMNNLLLRKDMCHWSRGMQIRFNLSQLEDWVRLNQMDGSGITEALESITQATQLLQVNKKTLEDVDAICEVCSKLNTLQVQKILSMYTPANEYEARVPSSVIRAVVARGHNKSEPMYLMVDTNYLYPVTLPFAPSAVSLDTVNIPEHLSLDFINVV